MASIPDIKAISYEICGSVRMVTAGCKAKVELIFTYILLLWYKQKGRINLHFLNSVASVLHNIRG